MRGIDPIWLLLLSSPSNEGVKDQCELLLGSLILPGRRDAQGVGVESVAPAWFEIIAMLKHDPEFLFKVDPRKLEEIIAGAYERSGFDEVTLTPRSGDLGRDVIAVKRGFYSVKIIDQVKRYAPNNPVQVDECGALLNVLNTVDRDATTGVVTTTSSFAPTLRDDPRIKPFTPHRLRLIDGPELVHRLEDLAVANPLGKV